MLMANNGKWKWEMNSVKGPRQKMERGKESKNLTQGFFCIRSYIQLAGFNLFHVSRKKGSHKQRGPPSRSTGCVNRGDLSRSCAPKAKQVDYYYDKTVVLRSPSKSGSLSDLTKPFTSGSTRSVKCRTKLYCF